MRRSKGLVKNATKVEAGQATQKKAAAKKKKLEKVLPLRCEACEMIISDMHRELGMRENTGEKKEVGWRLNSAGKRQKRKILVAHSDEFLENLLGAVCSHMDAPSSRQVDVEYPEEGPLFIELQALRKDESGKEVGALVKKLKKSTTAEGGRGPCEAKGVTSGDELIAVNGQETDGMSFAEVIGAIKGAGRPLTLRFERLFRFNPHKEHRKTCKDLVAEQDEEIMTAFQKEAELPVLLSQLCSKSFGYCPDSHWGWDVLGSRKLVGIARK
jgi:C-terminal processing protease CtpA/Prc